MITYNTYFNSEKELEDFIAKKQIEDSEKLMIQFFTSYTDEEFIRAKLKFLNRLYPNASLIGSTTDGLIKDGLVSTDNSVVTFTKLEHTKIKTYITDEFDDYFDAGEKLAKNLIQKDTKLIISFIDGLTGNGEEFLNGISSFNDKVIVSGGLASDNAKFEKTLVFDKENIYTNGAVGISLSSESLHIYTDYNFNWLPIGREMIVTKCDKNRVYTIDNKTATDTYQYYLGEGVSKKLPAVGIEFPLIIKRDGLSIARAALAKNEDGSLVFAGNFKNGDIVQFAYGDSHAILSSSNSSMDKISTYPIETIFLYSCMARRRFMPNDIANETLPYNSIAPTSGFFTYGEFFTGKKRELLNQTLTILALSESDEVAKKDIKYNVSVDGSSQHEDTIKALSNIVQVTSEEIYTINTKQTKIYNKLYEIGKNINETIEAEEL
ncbi:MAG: FIST N-terminal domain-containing protein, partial [Campylobacterota bacterium]|nr:FIST N-terminal domain-containing protein [Campylobacterota bacterium]